jgi:hypothetical protein
MIMPYNSSPESGITLETVAREGNWKILCTIYSDAMWDIYGRCSWRGEVQIFPLAVPMG